LLVHTLMTDNFGFSVTIHFKGKYLKKVHFRDKVAIGRETLRGNYRQAVKWFQF